MIILMKYTLKYWFLKNLNKIYLKYQRNITKISKKYIKNIYKK